MNKSQLKEQARKYFEAEVIIPKGYSNDRNENGLYVQEGLQTAWRNFWNGFEIAIERADLTRQFGPKPRHWETTVETIIAAANARNLPDDEAVSIGVWDRTVEPQKFEGIIRYNVGDFRHLALSEDISSAIPLSQISGKPKITTTMKAEHMGEHIFTITAECSKCLVSGPYMDCACCQGGIVYERKIVVPWETCKRIYQGMAETAMATATNTEA